MQPALQLALGSTLAALIAYAAYRLRSLSRSGAWGALLTGSIIFGLGGWQWAAVLLAFFISSSALTRLFRRRKAAAAEEFEKGGQRDLGQVLANGGIASLLAGLHFFCPSASWTWPAFAASLAAVNADTWATELGVLSPVRPRLITTWRQVERGTSGAISWHGTLAALLGALFIAVIGAALGPDRTFWLTMLVLAAAGLAGSMFDSLLGATVQAIYRCPSCAKETEKHPRHSCGTPTERIRGLASINNDVVNLACSAAGALIGWIL